MARPTPKKEHVGFAIEVLRPDNTTGVKRWKREGYLFSRRDEAHEYRNKRLLNEKAVRIVGVRVNAKPTEIPKDFYFNSLISDKKAVAK